MTAFALFAVITLAVLIAAGVFVTLFADEIRREGGPRARLKVLFALALICYVAGIGMLDVLLRETIF